VFATSLEISPTRLSRGGEIAGLAKHAGL